MTLSRAGMRGRRAAGEAGSAEDGGKRSNLTMSEFEKRPRNGIHRLFSFRSLTREGGVRRPAAAAADRKLCGELSISRCL